MDTLVRELQYEVLGLLSPALRRNDRYARRQAAQRRVIAFVWYGWAQELFCDAVGFTLGGPAFLQALTSYLTNFHPADFYVQPEELQQSSHPVSWLRIRFLCTRARAAGFQDAAEGLESRWEEIAQVMRASEDYHGFYDEVLREPLARTLEDMLAEASPRSFKDNDAAGRSWTPGVDTPVRLLNWAWQVHLEDPERYADWERM